MLKFILAVKRWWIEILIGLAILAFAGLWLNARHEAKVNEARAVAAEQAHENALQEAARGQEAVKHAEQLQVDLDAKEADRKLLLAKVGKLETELANRPIPPQPGPVPTEQAQVLADLREMGTSPEPLEPFRVAFPATDAPKIWTWGKQSLRVPGLESHIEAEKSLNLALKQALETTTAEMSTVIKQRDEFKDSTIHFGKAIQDEQDGRKQLQLQVGELTDQRNRARTTRIYIGIGSFLAGIYLGTKH